MNRRLTLRTLLAYLDDTLPASEIKDFGEKVAESDAAQELIARIKQVTRRRRLTVPPATGPSGIDPNDVAEYLEAHPGVSWTAAYELTADQVNSRLIDKYSAMADFERMGSKEWK